MRHPFRHSMLAPVLILVLLGAPVQARSDTRSDTVDVQHVMAAFHAAVVAHDGTRLAALFTAGGSSWFNVLSDQRYAVARAKAPDAAKVRVSSYQTFADFISKSKASLDPQRSNLRIQSDGIIATAYFDFRFMIDGKEQNRGSETWQLVRGVDGWRIAAIAYSSDLPAG